MVERENSGQSNIDTGSKNKRNIVTIVGVFDTREHAQGAMDDLEQSEYPMDQISVVARDSDAADEIESQYDADQGSSGAAAGASIGGVGGGLIGGLLGAGAIAVPGAGAIIAAGWAAGAIGGAIAGAGAGGWIGSLVNMGIPHDVAERYERQLGEGDFLILLRAEKGEQEEMLKDQLWSENATDVDSYDVDAKPEDQPGELLTHKQHQSKERDNQHETEAS